MDQDLLIVLDSQVQVFLEDSTFVRGVFIESDFSDSQYIGAVQEFRNHGNDFTGERDVFGFLGIDTEPGKMLDSVLSSSFWFEFC